MYSDQRCVYKAADIGEADIVVGWLSDHDIAAEVKDRYSAFVLQVSMIVAPAGIEVCVIDPNDVDRARELLRNHFEERKREPEPEDSGQTVKATCEDCGREAIFPFGQRGTVQTCPHCMEYIDVPE